MKIVQNIFVGLFVSFIGSIPIGYLNVIGYEIYQKFGLKETCYYLFGVITIEVFVIYFSLILAKQLTENKKLIWIFDVFSIIFMFFLALMFFLSSKNQDLNNHYLQKYVEYSSYFIGIILNCLNFMQVFFWASLNILLINKKKIEIEKSKKYFYIFGTALGTFFGMLTLILLMNYTTNQNTFLSKYLMKIIIPAFFIFFGVINIIKLYRKYKKNKATN